MMQEAAGEVSKKRCFRVATHYFHSWPKAETRWGIGDVRGSKHGLSSLTPGWLKDDLRRVAGGSRATWSLLSRHRSLHVEHRRDSPGARAPLAQAAPHSRFPHRLIAGGEAPEEALNLLTFRFPADPCQPGLRIWVRASPQGSIEPPRP